MPQCNAASFRHWRNDPAGCAGLILLQYWPVGCSLAAKGQDIFAFGVIIRHDIYLLPSAKNQPVSKYGIKSSLLHEDLVFKRLAIAQTATYNRFGAMEAGGFEPPSWRFCKSRKIKRIQRKCFF